MSFAATAVNAETPGAAPAKASERAKPAPAPKNLEVSAIDAGTKSCDDFYQYATGTWLKNNPIPSDKSRWGAFEELADRNRATLKAILEETAAKKDWPKGSNKQKVGDFYAIGMDEAAIEKAGLTPLEPWFARIDGLKSKAELPKLLAAIHEAGLPAGFGAFIAQDQKESTRYTVLLNQGGLGLPDRDYYTKDDAKSKEIKEKYVAHVTRVFELAGATKDEATAKAQVVIGFETRLAQAANTRVENRDPDKTYNKRTLAQVATEFPGFDFATYLATMGVPASHQDVIVRQPKFFTEFGIVANGTSVEEWKTYLKWHALRGAAAFLPKAFDEESFAFYGKTLQGVPEREERWKRVLAATDGAVGEALGQLYVEKAFSPKSKERMKVLIENLRAALKVRVEGLPWMGDETKKKALEKLAAFNVKIGYPDKWKDYSKLTISRKSYFDNVIAANKWDTAQDIAKLGKPIDRTEWQMTPPTVNAYYSPTMNEIVFPAGILQPPFFYAEADDAVNYGAIGVVIGHEMTHGFDDQGSKYDARGNLQNWWTDADRKAYDERTALMVKQFEGYKPLADQAINGKLTLGENIADLGGLKIAYAALQKAIGVDPKAGKAVEGFTPAQRFFLSYATVWRNNIRDEALRVRLNTDPHSPGKYRTLGPLSNLPEFHDAFSCPDGSPMKRAEADRPVIW